MISTVTGKQQVSIPASIARRAGLLRGAKLEWHLTGDPDILRVRVLSDPATRAADLQGRGRAIRGRTGSAVARLVKERTDDARASE
jgi:bifunctional DNA-binding transcriptional regulator/antitoxin component of YhaV-PrlF toxin-antitoxin module